MISPARDLLPTAELLARNAAHHLHPFSDMASLRRGGVRVISHGEGVWITDTDGLRYLDGMSGLWNVSLGHGRPEIREAVAAQMERLAFYNSFFRTTNPAVIELSKRLAAVTPPQFSRFFFTNSGSEANDTIVRMVRRYFDLMGQPRRKVIVSRRNGYHGSTVAGASLGGMAPMHAQGNLPIPDIVHVAQPYWFGEGGERSPEEFGLWAARDLERKLDELGEDRVAAFIAEPIQGAGGVIIPPGTYWPEVARICAERDILLISDEVICGFGRTGEWFGCQLYGTQPDFMTMAKAINSGALPLGAVAVSDRVADVLTDEGGDFNHGFTSSGHPACCAAAIATLDVMESERIVERVRDDIGPHLQDLWAELLRHPLVGEVRMVGLIGAIEIVADKSSRRRFSGDGAVGLVARDRSFANGLVMRAVGDTLVVAPPLVLSSDEADLLADRVWRTLDDVAAVVGVL